VHLASQLALVAHACHAVLIPALHALHAHHATLACLAVAPQAVKPHAHLIALLRVAV